MTYEVYRYVFLCALIGCGVMAAVSITLFFVLRIPRVLGDLTGRTARKAIADIRRQNEQTGDKAYKSSTVNLKRGRLTDKMTHSGRLVPRENQTFGAGISTAQLSDLQETHAKELDALAPGSETTVLEKNQEATTVLAPQGEDIGFTVEYEITFLHSDEVIA